MCHISHRAISEHTGRRFMWNIWRPVCLQPSESVLLQGGWSDRPRDELPGGTTGKMTTSCGNNVLKEMVSLSNVMEGA